MIGLIAKADYTSKKQAVYTNIDVYPMASESSHLGTSIHGDGRLEHGVHEQCTHLHYRASLAAELVVEPANDPVCYGTPSPLPSPVILYPIA